MGRKLIEVALPLKEINEASAKEKSIRYGHPSTLHLWWSRKPLAAARAVLFASIVDDPSSRADLYPTIEEQDAERERLFSMIRRMVKWESSSDERLLSEVREEIMRATDGAPPVVADPFCGGGSIPLEAQRLGLTAHASDLNPVAVLITKALIEIPPLFAGKPPIRPRDGSMATPQAWKGTSGLVADVRYYGEWMRERAHERIGHLYPKVALPVGGEAAVIAWLWMRTVTCPNPACGFRMPLTSKFDLSKKRGNEWHLVPRPEHKSRRIRFDIARGLSALAGTVSRAGAECLACGQPVDVQFIRTEALAGRLSSQIAAIVGEVGRGRVYCPADDMQDQVAGSAQPLWEPEGDMPTNPRWFSPPGFGLKTWASLFTQRQLTALTTYCDLITEARAQAHRDAVAAGFADDAIPLRDLGTGAQAYAEAISVYLSFALSRLTDIQNAQCTWEVTKTQVRHLFSRQAIPMVWDFAECGLFARAAGDFAVSLESLLRVLHVGRLTPAYASMGDARAFRTKAVVSTDPPYYDNVGYADLADFFYAWLRPALLNVYPDVMATVSTPKSAELVASPYRFGGSKAEARANFVQGLGDSFAAIRASADRRYPVTVYYAYKQAESTDDTGRVSTGWETMLEGLISSGFQIVGTWPLRTELMNRMVARETNALASSIVLVCRPRTEVAGIESRQNFARRLRTEMPEAIRALRHAALPPVDLGQAAIGPGMAVYTSYAKVLEPAGDRMPVRAALALINQVLDELLAEFDSEVDEPTRFLLAWYEQQGYAAGKFDEANKLATQKATAVSALVQEGLLEARGGMVRLLPRDELNPNWDPATDRRLTAWEACMYLVSRLEDPAGGVQATGALARSLGGFAEIARDLSYRLHQIATNTGRKEDAVAFNALVVEWPDIMAASEREPSGQGTLG
jgi:putative DNA methylase